MVNDSAVFYPLWRIKWQLVSVIEWKLPWYVPNNWKANFMLNLSVMTITLERVIVIIFSQWTYSESWNFFFQFKKWLKPQKVLDTFHVKFFFVLFFIVWNKVVLSTPHTYLPFQIIKFSLCKNLLPETTKARQELYSFSSSKKTYK